MSSYDGTPALHVRQHSPTSVRLHHMPDTPDNFAARHYQGAAGLAYHQGKRGIPPEAFPWVARLRAEKFAPHVGATDTVVEFGVGAGWNLAELKCARRIGFDVSDLLESGLSERGIEFVSESAALADAIADVVICHHMLEHALNPAASLAEMRRVLKPSGKLLLHVPFEEEPRYQKHDPAEPNHHLFSWNAQTLGNLVTECGFKLKSAGIGQFGYDRAAAAWVCRLRLGERGFRLLRSLAHLVLPASEVRVVAVR
ncbi:MAG: class I SAM-dependent methyltransferase [Proteobacteria bacterium]|nr:class I SAM-dependent methyltransferase [Verrucomicrobiota bacterium]NBU08263.1 class I SAM-dependent methyltransferase [Pseudomonadota bacterium]